jgi:hypothetical protein
VVYERLERRLEDAQTRIASTRGGFATVSGRGLCGYWALLDHPISSKKVAR